MKILILCIRSSLKWILIETIVKDFFKIEHPCGDYTVQCGLQTINDLFSQLTERFFLDKGLDSKR